MRVLLPAYKIPDGTEVTKRGGEKVYVKKEFVKVYRSDGNNKYIYPYRGCVFLVVAGAISEVTNSTMLLANLPDSDNCCFCCPGGK